MIQTVTDRRRIMIVAIICVLVINIVMPVRKAEAVVPALLAAPEVALAGFVGVVGIGAIGLDLFGQTKKADEMYAYASATWKTGNQYISDAYHGAINAAADWFAVAGPVVDSYTSKISQWLFAPAVDPRFKYGLSYGPYTSGGKGYYYIEPSASAGYALLTPFGLAKRVTYISTDPAVIAGGASYYIAYDVSRNIMGRADVGMHLAESDFQQGPDVIWPLVVAATGVSIVPSDYVVPDTDYKRARDAFPASIPVPSGRDFVYTPTATPGKDLYMQKDGKITDDAGKVYAPDAVTVKSGPVPQTVTDPKTGELVKDAAGNPVVAVPVGGVKTGDAATTIPGTLINVKTGEKVTTGDTVANPPLDWASQPTTSVNWAPLKMTGAALTRVFPFSIPWDVAAQLQIFNVKPEIPVIHVDIPRFWVAGDFVWHLKFDIDFTMFDPVAIGIRWIGNIAFTIGLALAMRRFMPQ